MRHSAFKYKRFANNIVLRHSAINQIQEKSFSMFSYTDKTLREKSFYFFLFLQALCNRGGGGGVGFHIWPQVQGPWLSSSQQVGIIMMIMIIIMMIMIIKTMMTYMTILFLSLGESFGESLGERQDGGAEHARGCSLFIMMMMMMLITMITITMMMMITMGGGVEHVRGCCIFPCFEFLGAGWAKNITF